MFAKIKLKYNDNPSTTNASACDASSPYQQRRNKFLLTRTLAISLIIFMLLLMSITYHGILLEQFSGLRQFVKRKGNHEEASEIDGTSKSIIYIPDSELISSSGQIATDDGIAVYNNDNKLRSLHMQNGQSKFSHLRYSRNIIDPLDPNTLEYDIDISKLKSQIRDKRTKFELSELERDFVRCKKDYSREKDCTIEFSKLYKAAKDLMDLFKDSAFIAEQKNSNSNEAPLDQENEYYKEEHNISEKVLKEKVPTTTTTTIPNSSTSTSSSSSLTTTTTSTSSSSSSSSSTSTTTTTTASPKTVKIKPLKISWIIDGFDDAIYDTINKNNLTTTSSTTSTTSKIDLEITEEFIPTESSEIVASQELPSSPKIFVPSKSTSITDKNVEQEEQLRKLKFDWIVGKANFTSDEEFFQDVKDLTTTTTTSTSTSNPLADPPNSVESNPIGAKDPTAESHIQKMMNSSHPLDYPTSLENMLESFEEESDTLKTINHSYVDTINETDLYDPTIWAKKFQEASAIHSQNEELLNTFTDSKMENMSKMGPKLNPANMKSLHADDAQLLSLCDRMAKRLRNKELESDSVKETQFTSRGPAGFPVTGESMKATAQFMFNPSFGMPSIPICFYLTPANFRMPSQVMPMWAQPSLSSSPSAFYGMPNYYGGPSSSLMTSGVGLGNVFFVPPNFGGTTGNIFPGSGVGNAQNVGQNIFPKTATLDKEQPQQFYCTYMQNHSNQGLHTASDNAASVGGSGSIGVGSNTFLNSNFKQRIANHSTHSSSPVNIIYASYAGMPSGVAASLLDSKIPLKCSLPGQVACHSVNECIMESSWCDSTVDCSDGSDEATCTCQDRLSSNRLCDGYPDCPMGEDEIGCFGCDSFMYSCYANAHEYERFNRSTISMCYNVLDRCDGIANCLNGRDESECNILVSDLTHHMSHSVSSSEGFLYHNHRGEWYPVCNNADIWAKNACKIEGGYVKEPEIMLREIALKGPFVAPSNKLNQGEINLMHSCEGSTSIGTVATYVKCAQSQCGIRKTTFLKSKRQLKGRKKRIIARQEESEEQGNGSHDDLDTDVADTDSERIVGGKYSKPMAWPFVVAIYRNGKFHCGGTIYNERWIISAAHCAINYQKYYYEVRAGLLRRTSFSAATQIQSVSQIIVHQNYDRVSMRNDLSLMRLAESLRFNRWVKPICLPDIGRTTNGTDWIWGPEAGVLCTAVGWGAIREKGPASDHLREVVVPIRKQCKERIDRESESICAGDMDGGRDACQGDSGGPLFCKSITNHKEWYLVGVVSHGNGCARSGEFGVYTRVAIYLDWIEMATNTKNLLPKLQPVQECPGYVCVWGGKRCIPKKKHCDRITDCLGGEDEVGCVYNFIPDLGSALNTTTTTTTTESDYFPENELETTTIEQNQNEDMEISTIPSETPKPTTTTTTTAVFSTETIEMKTTTTTMETTTNPSIVVESSKPAIIITTTTTEGITFYTEASNTTSNSTESMIEIATTTTITPAMIPTTTTTMTTTTTESIAATVPYTETTIAPKTKSNKTLPGKFICKRIAQIIELKHRCDRRVDCEDGTDEENCKCRDYLKASLSILICDGKTDCEDGSDEHNCGHCKTDEFLCPLSRTCISISKRCNNFGDCRFQEDEKDCFALTNGKNVQQDIDKRPMFSNSGIFTRNINGKWNIVCVEEYSLDDADAKIATEICNLLGFKGYKLFNTTTEKRATSFSHDHTVRPIDPEIAKQPRIKSHLVSAVKDNFHYSSNEKFFPLSSFKESAEKELENSERVAQHESKDKNCHGIYIECNEASDIKRPLKTLTAGSMVIPNGLDLEKLKPSLKTYLKPNVYVKPEIPTQLIDKKEEAFDKLDTENTSKKNLSIFANNELHEAVEELHWPWLVDIYANGKLWCLGVLIDKYWIMVHESCYFGVRLNTDYISALFGGGKTKNIPHKSPHEQIRRIDCYQRVQGSDIILYHLEHRVHFSHQILPIYLPEGDNYDADDENVNDDYDEEHECMAILHDELTGLIKSLPIIKHKEKKECEASKKGCYRLMENANELMKITLDVINANATDIDAKYPRTSESKASNDLLNALSKLTICTQFGLKTTLRNTIEPIDQGILVCRNVHNSNNVWFPAALFSYNNTDCQSFKHPFGIRTLEKLYNIIQTMIDEKDCSISYNEPICETMRCPLGNCLSSEEMCNQSYDCHDGSDEDATFCTEYKRGCEPWEMQCRTSKKCIPKSKFCDHVPDCEDYTDEPTICSCYTYLKATDPGKICDGVRNCWDKSDESPVLCNCTADLFSCGITSRSNECIPKDFVCDKEPDCPNGEDEQYCYGIEQPQLTPIHKNDPDHVDPSRPPKYGQVIEQSYGVWHTKCFPRSSPPDISEIRRICRQLGYTPYRQPSYRLIDDNENEVIETNESKIDERHRTMPIEDNATKSNEYRYATKAIVVSKFSPIRLNDQLTIFMKPSRPIAELVRWNSTDSSRCFKLEIRCG